MSQVQHLYCVSREVGWESGARVVNMSVSADVDRKCRQVVGWESGARVASMSASSNVDRKCRQAVAPSMGLEPTSFSSTGSCSNQLSYDGKRCSGGSPEGWVSEARVANMSVYAVLGRKSRGVTVGTLGIEPRTPG